MYNRSPVRDQYKGMLETSEYLFSHRLISTSSHGNGHCSVTIRSDSDPCFRWGQKHGFLRQSEKNSEGGYQTEEERNVAARQSMLKPKLLR